MKAQYLKPLAAILILALFVVPWISAIGDGLLYYRDHSQLFRRLLLEVTEAYGSGHWPHWSTLAGGGEPLAANPNASAYSPFLLAFLLPFGFHQNYDLFVYLHYPVMAVGFAYFLRGLSIPRGAAALAAVAITFCGPMLSMADNIAHLLSTAFAGFFLGGLVRTIGSADRRPRTFAVLAVATAIHVPVSDPYFIAGEAILLLAWFASTRPWTAPTVQAKRVGFAAFAVVLGLMLIAFALLPRLALMGDAELRSGGFHYDVISNFCLTPLRAVELVFPGFSGNIFNREFLWSSATVGQYLVTIYLGASLLPLMAIGAADKRSRWVWIPAGLVLLLAFGRYTPVHRWFVTLVPGLDTSRYPEKFTVTLALLLMVPLGVGIEQVVKRLHGEITRLPWVPVAISAALVGVPGGLGLYVGLVEAQTYAAEAAAELSILLTEAAMRGFGVLAISSALLALIGRSTTETKKLPAFAAMLLLVCTLDVWRTADHAIQTSDSDLYDASEAVTLILKDQKSPTVFQYDAFHPPTSAGGSEDVTQHMRDRLFPGMAALHGLRYVLGPDIETFRTEEWYNIETHFGEAGDEIQRQHLLGRFGVSHLVMDAGGADLPGLVRLGGAKVHRGDLIDVYRLKSSRPSVALMTHAVLTGNAAEEKRMLTTAPVSALGVRESSLVSHLAGDNDVPDDGIVERPPCPPPNVRANRAGILEVQTGCERPSVLFSAQAYRDGWMATVDGEPADIHLAGGFAQAVAVPAGEHEIRLEYTAPGFRPGLMLSASGLLILLAVGLSLRHRKSAA